jgi:hypothetical protein
MLCRVSAAVAAAAIAAMLLVPAQSDARGGGGAGHGGGFRPPMRPMHPVHPPLIHRHDPLFVHRKFHDRHAFDHRRHRRNVFAFPGYGYGGYGGGNGYGDNGYGDNGYGDDSYGDNSYGDNGYGGSSNCTYGYGYGSPRICGTYTAFYGRYYDPSDMPGSIWVPPYTVRPALIMSIAKDPPSARGGCRSETVPVAEPGGAENSVTITRC